MIYPIMETLTFKDRIARSKDSQRKALVGMLGTRLASMPPCSSPDGHRQVPVTNDAALASSVSNVSPGQTEDLRVMDSPKRADYLLYLSEFKRLVGVATYLYDYSKAGALEMSERIIGLGEEGFGQVVSSIRQWRVDAIVLMMNQPGLDVFMNPELEQRARSQYRIDVMRCHADENGKKYENWVGFY